MNPDLENFVFYGADKRIVPLDWRALFDEKTLEEAKKLLPDVSTISDRLRYFRWGNRDEFMVGRNRTSIELPKYMTQRWSAYSYDCSCKSAKPCKHIAASFLYMEKKKGGLTVTEDDWTYHERLEQEALMKKLLEEQERWEKEKLHVFPALEYYKKRQNFADAGKTMFYDMKGVLAEYQTNTFFTKQARQIEKDRKFDSLSFEKYQDEQGEETVSVSARYFDLDYEDIYTKALVDRKKLWSTVCSCRQKRELEKSKTGSKILCGHELHLIGKLWEYIEQDAKEDITDSNAMQFFEDIRSEAEERLREQDEHKTGLTEERKKEVVLAPRITRGDDGIKLDFKIGIEGNRLLICKKLEQFYFACVNRISFEASKKLKFDFKTQDLTEESEKWMGYLTRRIKDISDYNKQLENRRGRMFYRTPMLDVSYQQELKGGTLDSFYELAEDSRCEFQDAGNGEKTGEIRIGHEDVNLNLDIYKLSDAKEQFAGVFVSGKMPLLLKGANYTYILDRNRLSRIEKREQKLLKPFLRAADEKGDFRVRVGLSHLREFYYRVLPRLDENASVDIRNHCAEEVKAYLPPEANFTFYVDCADDVLSCQCEVDYGGQAFEVTKAPTVGNDERDEDQENRVREVLHEIFQNCSSEGEWRKEDYTEEDLYDFLENGIEKLEYYGTVKGTEFFRKQKVVKIPNMMVGVSVESGLMDLSLTSKEADEEELLQILEGYRKKKKFFRLKSGAFVDLSEDERMEEMERFFREMDILPIEAIKKKIKLPLYRALYLNRMLENHEQLTAARDRTYRALVRNFKTIQNADYEPPKALDGVMREYQNTGFKWLKTLEESGFGGILADEMGLGKTLQILSLLSSDKEQGITKPSIVICPASLVYNWVEEAHRFAPNLRVAALSGTVSERKRLFEGMKDLNSSEYCDLYVTSYELCKRDIDRYETVSFHSCILDEAQYIKNQRAAAAKSVKILSADHRYALTGTPIENRLSELWSIFDYLMPGFLYGSEEFVKKFERPIAKEKDKEATEKLKNMVSPFILRRLKTDVLKDLPEKLEEVQYAHISGEQQKVYDAQVLHMRRMLEDGFSSGEDKIRVLAELTKIRQICCDPSLLFEDYKGESAKRIACMDLVKSAIDSGHRMLLFSQFTSMLALLEEDLKREGIEYYKITGSTPKRERLSLVRRFNEGTIPVFLISLKAGGTGLNLTGADVVIHYDPWWNLAAQNQATDRAHRIGQTKKVSVYRLIIKDSIEEKILKLQESKKDLADAILEGESQSLMSMSSDELLELLA